MLIVMKIFMKATLKLNKNKLDFDLDSLLNKRYLLNKKN